MPLTVSQLGLTCLAGYGKPPEAAARVLATEQYLFDVLSTPTGMPRHQLNRNGGMQAPFHGPASHYAAESMGAEAPSFYNYSYDEIKALRSQRAVRDPPPPCVSTIVCKSHSRAADK